MTTCIELDSLLVVLMMIVLFGVRQFGVGLSWLVVFQVVSVICVRIGLGILCIVVGSLA